MITAQGVIYVLYIKNDCPPPWHSWETTTLAIYKLTSLEMDAHKFYKDITEVIYINLL